MVNSLKDVLGGREVKCTKCDGGFVKPYPLNPDLFRCVWCGEYYGESAVVALLAMEGEA